MLPRSYSTTDLPDSTDTTYTSLATHIVKSSREVDSALAPHFCTFNAHDHSTYPCPHIIRDITANLAASRCFFQLAIGDRNSAYGKRGQEHRERAQGLLDSILSVDTPDGGPRFYAIANETVSSETLTFGAGGEYDLDESEAFINVQTNLTSVDMPLILVDSVKVTATGLTLYGYGRDFTVRFDTLRSKWVFTDIKGDLKDAAVTKTISYDWSWKRYAEKQGETEAAPGLLGGWM